MDTPIITQEDKVKRGAEDSGPYFRYMTEFVGFTEADALAIKQSQLVIEKYIPSIVADFYAHLLRYPPTRKYFLKADGSIDQDYLQKRMSHLGNFWRRTAGGVYDDDYARYVDYVGRAHTSHGADPNIYIAERYVIGQVGFMQRAITNALAKELHEYDEDLEHRAVRAWNLLMMVILEMLSRAYGKEHEAEAHEKYSAVDDAAVLDLAVEAYEVGLGLVRERQTKQVFVGRIDEIQDGERKLVEVDGRSIGVFHHKGQWYSVINHCLHRGGPVATGSLVQDTLTCPWHGFQYNVTTGQMLSDPTMKLEMYPVTLQDGEIYITVPEMEASSAKPGAEGQAATAQAKPAQTASSQTASSQTAPLPPAEETQLKENEFEASDLAPGQARMVYVNGVAVAVYNVGGAFYATQNACTHQGGPLSEGKLAGSTVICPWHGSCFNVTNGAVQCGPAVEPVKTFHVTVEDGIGRVE
jgi:nitrite reductase/ring-hydroxylating ferredoxin subunit